MGAFEYVSPDLRPLMITRTGGGEVWVIRIGLPGERCIFRWTWDLINEPWQEKLNVSATSRLTIFKDLYPSGGQRFYQLEIR